VNRENVAEGESLGLEALLRPDNPNVFHPVIEEEVKLALKTLKNNKAPGDDCITNENLKMLIPLIIPEMTEFFNLIIMETGVPDKWKTAVMKLLYKNKGDRNDVNSYRGGVTPRAVGDSGTYADPRCAPKGGRSASRVLPPSPSSAHDLKLYSQISNSLPENKPYLSFYQ
jgi:hypothetical protein